MANSVVAEDHLSSCRSKTVPLPDEGHDFVVVVGMLVRLSAWMWGEPAWW